MKCRGVVVNEGMSTCFTCKRKGKRKEWTYVETKDMREGKGVRWINNGEERNGLA